MQDLYALTPEEKDSLAALPEPWCHFRLDDNFYETWSAGDHGIFDKTYVLREIVHRTFPHEPALVMGRKPNLISPYFWECRSANSPRDVRSLVKRRGVPISRAKYERNKLEWRYRQKSIHIVVVAPSVLVKGILDDARSEEFSVEEFHQQVERRIGAIDAFMESIRLGEWPRLLLVVPEYDPLSWWSSLTVTRRLRILTYFRTGPDKHFGDFRYRPHDSNAGREFRAHWIEVKKHYIDTRADAPSDLSSAQDIPECPGREGFNLHSLESIRSELQNLLEIELPLQSEPAENYRRATAAKPPGHQNMVQPKRPRRGSRREYTSKERKRFICLYELVEKNARKMLEVFPLFFEDRVVTQAESLTRELH